LRTAGIFTRFFKSAMPLRNPAGVAAGGAIPDAPRESVAGVALVDANCPGLGWVEAVAVGPHAFRPLFRDQVFHDVETAALGSFSYQGAPAVPGQGVDVMVLNSATWYCGIVESCDRQHVRVFVPDLDTAIVLPPRSALLRRLGSETGKSHGDTMLRWLTTRQAPRALDDDLDAYTAALASIGLKVERARGDGNCLYRAVSLQMYGTQQHHAAVRAAVAGYMRIEAEYFEPFVECPDGFQAYVDSVATDGVWGDDPEVQAVAEIYQRPVIVYGLDAGRLVLRRSIEGGGEPVRLSYYKGGHYDSVVPLQQTQPRGADAAAAVGRLEARALNLGSVSRALQDSDALATELVQVNAARAKSRAAYETYRQGRAAGRCSAEEDVLETALAQSAQQHDEDALLAAALKASLVDANNAAAGSWADNDDDDALLRIALQESLRFDR